MEVLILGVNTLYSVSACILVAWKGNAAFEVKELICKLALAYLG